MTDAEHANVLRRVPVRSEPGYTATELRAALERAIELLERENQLAQDLERWTREDFHKRKFQRVELHTLEDDDD